MLSVRSSCCERKGKANSFICEGFAFDTRRPSPTKGGELFQQSRSYLLLWAEQWWSSPKTSPLYVHHHAESGFKLREFRKWLFLITYSKKTIGFKLEQTRCVSFSGIRPFWWSSCDEKRLQFEEVTKLLGKKFLVYGHFDSSYGCFA